LPTEAELEVLNVLWQRGPSTVREVHEVLQADRSTAMTTTLKIIQYMEAKGLVRRGEGRPARFMAAIGREKTQAGLLGDLVRRAFDGSVRKLLVRAVEDVGISPDEYDQLRKLIGARKRKQGG
jgi:predicted transcriptional regulator